MRDGWKIVKLDEIISFERGLTYAKGDEVAHSSVGVLRSNNVDLTTQSLNLDEIKYLREDFEVPEKKKVRKSSLLMCMSNGSKDHLGKVALIDEDLDYAFGGFMGLLTPDETKVVPKYLYYALASKSFKDYIHSLADGANINNLKYKDLAAYDILLLPLPEQQRIVDFLDREFAKIDALKANAEKSLQAAKDLFQATLKKELEPKEGWSVAEIGSVCLKTDNIKWRDIPEDKEYTYIDLTSVDRSTKSVVEPQRIKKSNAPSRAQRLVCEDDIVFATTRPTLRRYCIITEQYDGQICSTGFCVLRPDKRKVRPSWLFHCLSTDAFYDYVEPLQTGATYPAITDKDVKGYTISLPTITEQDDIVSRLDVLNDKCNALQENYQKTLTLCDDLKQSLLRKAFNGEL